jgi:hypothetical protein
MKWIDLLMVHKAVAIAIPAVIVFYAAAVSVPMTNNINAPLRSNGRLSTS